MDVILSIASLAGSLLAVYLAWRKLPHDLKRVESDTSKVFAEAAEMAASQNIKLQEQIARLEQRLDEQDECIRQLTETLRSKDARISELETLTHNQGERIRELESELDALRRRRKPHA